MSQRPRRAGVDYTKKIVISSSEDEDSSSDSDEDTITLKELARRQSASSRGSSPATSQREVDTTDVFENMRQRVLRKRQMEENKIEREEQIRKMARMDEEDKAFEIQSQLDALDERREEMPYLKVLTNLNKYRHHATSPRFRRESLSSPSLQSLNSAMDNPTSTTSQFLRSIFPAPTQSLSAKSSGGGAADPKNDDDGYQEMFKAFRSFYCQLANVEAPYSFIMSCIPKMVLQCDPPADGFRLTLDLVKIVLRDIGYRESLLKAVETETFDFSPIAADDAREPELPTPRKPETTPKPMRSGRRCREPQAAASSPESTAQSNDSGDIFSASVTQTPMSKEARQKKQRDDSYLSSEPLPCNLHVRRSAHHFFVLATLLVRTGWIDMTNDELLQFLGFLLLLAVSAKLPTSIYLKDLLATVIETLSKRNAFSKGPKGWAVQGLKRQFQALRLPRSMVAAIVDFFPNNTLNQLAFKQELILCLLAGEDATLEDGIVAYLDQLTLDRGVPFEEQAQKLTRAYVYSAIARVSCAESRKDSKKRAENIESLDKLHACLQRFRPDCALSSGLLTHPTSICSLVLEAAHSSTERAPT